MGIAMVEPDIKVEYTLTGNGRVRDHRGQEATVKYCVVVSKDEKCAQDD